MRNSVELLGYYGGDLTHAASAWTSRTRDITPEMMARIPDLLINKLMGQDNPEHGPPHTTPFEKSAIHFLLTTDIATHIHLLKHRIGVSVNAESARYKELKNDKFHVPEDWPEWARLMLGSYTEAAAKEYHDVMAKLIAGGMPRARAKESARYFLPYSTQITQDVMFNFLSFAHFQQLRNERHAQREIRGIAEEMLSLVRETGAFEHSLAAFGLSTEGINGQTASSP